MAERKPQIKLSEMAVEELRSLAREMKNEIEKTRLGTAVKKTKNTRVFFNLRKKLARVLTEIKIKMR
ncbi:hypothetical protein A3D85_03180 [Candidatus Amesbacteria bacterium RIFCSPHIGHO2_02_FULL_47_9]|uniref:Large ribosomal subunit protein uL29 n=2 Tax=Microgenomates group TaxID=1794810 RepID=A0A0H4TD91_9BACT|nr:hypothetical protein [uncultured Microgenomates bacterium Rifle_16ft_4_minimus_5815]OGC93030.1 MAG: hypothetical protein A2876_00585 [Candidatus Amesbacteria bacterium RIFCSPHIGHO2_01_FULL_48_32b]OGD05197.1 MAG: hypothetical protein A3D85_03180 [Candidatus Amesbacteria bacterium RIFCSPHIGHO2_02_FULL_47_9]OGD07485.1 MAG: hypothetical protein A2899_04245 [Candidatus Amesbacteria bacterium RIFCSPLOWO2_01_FULL_49_25]